MFKLISLNLNGIRSAARKGVQAWVERVNPDCMCVQELKAQADDVLGTFDSIANLQGYFHFAQKKGYSGVGVYTKHTPSDVIVGFDGGEFDDEGRYVELRFDTPKRNFSVISSYFPSGSSGEDRQDAKYRFLDAMGPHLRALREQREFVLCGDINISHQEIDLKNWRSNQKNSGFLPDERAWMTQLIADSKVLDVYRQLHPETTDACYTWWSNRGQAYSNNVGWRLDYHLATASIGSKAKRAEIFKDERFSDHAPITIEYDFSI
ncbi:MAG: exodeoxyribonuclease III [Limnohabitans sp.]|nr:exodeoxyribonuclease III [Limnohabitans sp.]